MVNSYEIREDSLPNHVLDQTIHHIGLITLKIPASHVDTEAEFAGTDVLLHEAHHVLLTLLEMPSHLRDRDLRQIKVISTGNNEAVHHDYLLQRIQVLLVLRQTLVTVSLHFRYVQDR